MPDGTKILRVRSTWKAERVIEIPAEDYDRWQTAGGPAAPLDALPESIVEQIDSDGAYLSDWEIFTSE